MVCESRPGPQEFKINGLINGRHYLDLVGNNQIQLTSQPQKEPACQREQAYCARYRSNVAAVGLALENNADKKIGLTFPASNALVTSRLQPPPRTLPSQKKNERPFWLNYRRRCGMWSVGSKAGDNFRAITPVPSSRKEHMCSPHQTSTASYIFGIFCNEHFHVMSG